MNDRTRASDIGRCAVMLATLGLACGPGTPSDEAGDSEATTVASTSTSTDPVPTSSAPTSAETSATSTEDTGTEPTTGDPPAFCLPAPSLPRRLSNRQYLNTLADLLPGTTLPPLVLPPNQRIEGFENIADANPDDPQVLAMFAAAAEIVAEAATKQGGPWLPCAPGGGPDPKACGHAFLPGFTALALRRPMKAGEVAALLAEFDSLLELGGFDAALTSALATTFGSDEFLHLRETTDNPIEGQPTMIQLSGFELAARMSYFLWDTMPDQDLHDAAAAGKLDTVKGVAEQAGFMLSTGKTVPGLTRFVRQWLYLHALEQDGDPFPADLPPGLWQPMANEVSQFVGHVLQDGDGTLAALLTSPVAFIDDQLAAIYDVPPPPPESIKVELDPARRPGLLTRAGWLALRSIGDSHSPFQRGWRINDSLLCQQLPPPPPDIELVPPGELPPDATTRERYDTILADPSCAGCHIPAHRVGYGLENYDLLGKWQDQEHGHQVDVSGELVAELGTDASGPFSGSAELMQRLAASRSVHDCVTRKAYMYALGRMLGDADTCALTALQGPFFASGGHIKDMLVAIIVSDGFRHRLAP